MAQPLNPLARRSQVSDQAIDRMDPFGVAQRERTLNTRRDIAMGNAPIPGTWTPRGTPMSFADWQKAGGVAQGNNDPYYEWANSQYQLPSYAGAGNFLEKTLRNMPGTLALGFATAGATGGLDQFAAGAGETLAGGSGTSGVISNAGTGAAPSVNVGPVNLPVGTDLAAPELVGGGTPLSRLLNLPQGATDLLSVLGTGGATALGMHSANKKAGALRDIANQSRADRAPFLNTANNYLANPSAYIQGPGQAAMKGVLHGLSAKFGNPIGSGAALQIATDSALNDWRNATIGFANIGLSGEDTRAQLQAGAAGSEADKFTTLAGGISDVVNPRRTLADLAREYKSLGLI